MTFRYIKSIAALTVLMFFASTGSIMTATMSVPHQYLHFTLGDDDDIYIYLSAPDSTDEIAAIPFSLHFSDNAPSGIMTKIKIRISFDESNLIYDSAAPTANWPGVIDEDPLEHDPDNGIICLEFVQAPDVPVPTISTQYATLYFRASCQEELNVNDIDFNRLSNDNFVDIYDNGTYSYSPQNWDDGTVTITDYEGSFEIDQVDGYLGDNSITVPVFGTTTFNMFGLFHIIAYDTTKLDFIEGEVDTIAFPHATSYSYFVEFSPGRITAVPYTTLHYPAAPVTDQEVYYLKFDVLAETDDYVCDLEFIYDSGGVLVYVSHEPGSMVCNDLMPCVPEEDYTNGNITIPEYTVALRSVYDGDPIVKGVGTAYLDFDIDMLNNYPAGDYSDQNENGGVGTVFELHDCLTHYDLTEDTGAPDFYHLTYSNGERILYAYQVYNAARDNYWAPQTEYVNLFHETVTFNEANFEPDYDNRTIGLEFRDEFILNPYDWHTHVEDTTGTVDADSTNGKLTWEVIGAEVKMGEFYTPHVVSNLRYVDQALYIRANFDIGRFAVTVTVEGDVEIESVTPEASGVGYTMYNDTTVRIYWYGTGTFHSATGDVYYKIATIEYWIDCMGTGKMAAYKYERPWIPHNVLGEVSFHNYYIKDDTSFSHFVDPEPNNIKSYYCNEDSMYQMEKDVATIPMEFYLHANRPNPFNPTTTILYDVPSAEHVNLEVYNILGRKIRTLVDEVKATGTHEAYWDGTDDYGTRVASGIYLCNMQAGNYMQSMKMMLMK